MFINQPNIRDNSPYWRKRLLHNAPTQFYKYNQHGLKSPVFWIVKIAIVDSPKKYLEEGLLHTDKAILIVGEKE